MIQNIDRAGLDTAVWTHSIISICTESESEGGCLDLDLGAGFLTLCLGSSCAVFN